jgi:uncharacterized membrane protein YhaH (DUF805 family)
MLNFIFGFNGRIRRTHYFLGSLLVGLISGAFGLHWLRVNHYMSFSGYDGYDSFAYIPPGFWFVGSIIYLACRWAVLALAAKRWHDAGTTGWLAILSLIPGVDFIVFIILCLLSPTRGSNPYGPDPRPATAAFA